MAKEAAQRVSQEKFLTFLLGEEEYGIEILKVREIIGMMDITPVPQTPPFIKGVINLRGKVIPVLDLRLKFGMEECQPDERTCIIVVEIQGYEGPMLMGVVVDRVREVLSITSEEIAPPPPMGFSVEASYILGMARHEERVKILLDIDRILSLEELQSVPSEDQPGRQESSESKRAEA
jgi:purine-binding chemotaxis protein CheW